MYVRAVEWANKPTNHPVRKAGPAERSVVKVKERERGRSIHTCICSKRGKREAESGLGTKKASKTHE